MEAEQWGRRIRAFRKLKGYTQIGLAEAIGVSVSVLGAVERGNRMPSKSLISKICIELEISLEELMPTENN